MGEVSRSVRESSPILNESNRKLFEDCSLIEIVHFHECLRGELKTLYSNVCSLLQQVLDFEEKGEVLDDHHFNLEFQVMSQFQLLWAVFQSHSTAEDEFIWPALKEKTSSQNESHMLKDYEDNTGVNDHEYAKEHHQENALFQNMDRLLAELRVTQKDMKKRKEILGELKQKTCSTLTHLLNHLHKEETSALPLVKKYFSSDEVETLVGKIMGKRPSELMRTILGMMIKNLNPDDVGSMMGYMRQAVKDTYFEKWLACGGFSWDKLHNQNSSSTRKRSISFERDKLHYNHDCSIATEFLELGILRADQITTDPNFRENNFRNFCPLCHILDNRVNREKQMSENEFRAAVKKISRLTGVTLGHKTALIQTLRNLMYSRYKKQKPPASVNQKKTYTSNKEKICGTSKSDCSSASFLIAFNGSLKHGDAGTVDMQLMPASKYFSDDHSEIEKSISPFFIKSELEITWHQLPVRNTAGIMGCPHYRRASKIRAPCCGHLFTCRLCHDQVMDHSMDRYKVTEMLCMHCCSLQPISNYCMNSDCAAKTTVTNNDTNDSSGEHHNSNGALSNYYCSICHLHDDLYTKDIYHCPYCNVCRLGKGLGIDFCHCMKCNACISIHLEKSHRCVSHSLEGQCPICSSGLFDSTQQVKGLKCGHFLHLHCYREYVRHNDQSNHWYRCPICLKSMDDMTEYFGQLDAVVASQPMPVEFEGCVAEVLCHDCEQFSKVPYHFCFQKCASCGSYNTRMEELIRSSLEH